MGIGKFVAKWVIGVESGLLCDLIQESGLLNHLIEEILAFESWRLLGDLIRESLESKSRDRDRRDRESGSPGSLGKYSRSIPLMIFLSCMTV